MIKKITFEIETITPMFLAGAEQGKAELRAASIKGLLRFWWRALQAESDIEKLRNRESQIFGSSDEKMGGGSSFAIRITSDSNLQPVTKSFPFKDNIHKIMVTSKSKNKTFPINILEYLAYGPYDPRTKKIRPYFDAKTKFNLILHVFNDSFTDEILKAIHVFAFFGGIGSRSRNGFGSFFITQQDGVRSPVGDIDLSVSLKKRVNHNVTLQPYSSFSHGTKIFCGKKPYDTWDEALADVGKTYRDIRVGNKKVNESVFESKHTYRKREYLGAPLDPFQESFHSLLERHAKPYFMKIAKEDNKYRSYILYLPSQYCTGLSEDRNRKPINHNVANIKFTEACNEFNAFLREHMEAIL